MEEQQVSALRAAVRTRQGLFWFNYVQVIGGMSPIDPGSQTLAKYYINYENRSYVAGRTAGIKGWPRQLIGDTQFQRDYDQGYQDGLKVRPFDPDVRDREM